MTLNTPLLAAISLISQLTHAEVLTESPLPIMLSAYAGIENSIQVYRVAGCQRALWQRGTGMPVVFNVEINPNTLDALDFLVSFQTSNQTEISIHPDCVSLAPADEDYENRTVLLVGQFDGRSLTKVEVSPSARLTDEDGYSLAGLSAQSISRLGRAEQLVYAEDLAETEWQPDECPQSTVQQIQVTWNGGITGPQASARNDDIQATDYLISYTNENAEQIFHSPDALGDLNDGDNNHILCLNERLQSADHTAIVTGLAEEFCSPDDICTRFDSHIQLRLPEAPQSLR